jgi:Asp-tRNA(Asn)/Glu-tRNA(Gln) amidotransferase A subunit family amidase
MESRLVRIEAVNPQVSAVTVVLADSALDAADGVDRAVRSGTDVAGLARVPLAVKENIDVAGSATTLGIVALREVMPAGDAPHVGELRAAGAIPLARTNMPEFGMRWHTANGLRAATRNPWSARSVTWSWRSRTCAGGLAGTRGTRLSRCRGRRYRRLLASRWSPTRSAPPTTAMSLSRQGSRRH